MVSICCTTYNQEDYIRDAIESFIMQKADFKYEIIINDDASSDHTAEIVKEYEKKYPNLIKALYQKENQFSQGVDVWYYYNFLPARGKYIAICEGDDFWSDPFKLQKQVDILEKYSECSLCFHSVRRIEAASKKELNTIPKQLKEGFIRQERIIQLHANDVPTPSLMFPRKHIKALPQFYFECKVKDFPLQLYLGNLGPAYYLEDTMANYRVSSKGSFSENLRQTIEKDDKTKFMLYQNNIIKMLEQFDKNSNYEYHESVKKIINDCKISILENRNDYKAIIKNYKKHFNSYSIKRRIKIYIKCKVPSLIHLYKIIKSR